MNKTLKRFGRPPGTPNFNHGFTLVELLVVITIIAVLAGVIFALTQKIRTKAYQAKAMSSLRQIGAFNAGYSAENNGDINTLRWDGEKTEGPKGGNTWVINTFWGRFQPYLCPDVDTKNQPQLSNQIKLRLDSLFSTDTNAGRPNRTPEGPTMPGTIVSNLKVNSDISGLPVPISFNDNLHKWDTVIKVSSVGNPSEILYATFGSGFFKESDGKTYVPKPTDKYTSKPIYYMDDKKALFVFLDGHVESLSAPIPSRKFQ
jgi:prepilin-type N-terminal cleavage/methylation domain-containing protein